jgi:protein-L-isoaspartate(D-aspartate) O-methyltransferase
VIQVGAGSGYYTAILAQLVGATGRVTAYEIEPALAARAVETLRGTPQVQVVATTGAADALPEADAIYVCAGLAQPHPTWLDALRPGGRLIFPLQPEGGYGGMLMVTKPVAGGLARALRAARRLRGLPHRPARRVRDRPGRSLRRRVVGPGAGLAAGSRGGRDLLVRRRWLVAVDRGALAPAADHPADREG